MDNFITRLSRLDACAISDALDKLGLHGSVSGIHRYSTDRRISGRVVTVRLEKDDGRPAASRHLGTTAIEAAQPGDVIVLEQRTGIDAACWGGNLTLGAQLRGISGVIIEGPGRDMDEARQYDFPVFARDHTARTARGRIVETGTNVPITVGDVSVSPGDYVVADGSAVVFAPALEIERVLEAAEAIADRERAMVTALREGTPISQVMGKSYETLLKKS
ncbi:MAG TPA: RraA family protein [Vicinamibacterales bacterium]|nr:RraA family protein [Vicinamibacterales bacterium]